ncbi:hypothetical protein SELMODRAFT_127796 [Selaginella moellendorffii]|uniref:TOG domain-containing protein n=1 Tax=Selaginella moellendorffii TaxID=88036 RepID=D8SXV8_SELML|nr:hypothetical protein SELMODRAFT_127796 [Selaginella moellendorffii]
MEDAIQQLCAKDTKERMAGVERLQTLLENSRKGLSVTEASHLVDATLGLLKDNNFKVCQGALQALALAAALAGEHLKFHFNALLPAVVERLGDGKQPVRDAARRLLLALMEISSPSTIVERSGNCAWTHKNWRVREEFARTAASAINLFSANELQRLLLPPILPLLEDSNTSVREAAMMCVEEMYRQGGIQFKEELQRHSLRASQLKDILSRFDKIVIKTQNLSLAPEPKHSSTGNRRNSPKAKSSLEIPNKICLHAVEAEASDKPVEPIRVSSDRDLAKEIEKVASMLTPEQDWSVRIAAMQRVEGLVAGGAVEHMCFPSLLKQLVGPLSLQLSDRRSSIVKQACHLMNLLSKNLLSDFEAIAEAIIPVLFKLVVITVLVIAESADNCIKTMLRNCRVARVLPRIVDSAKNDRNATLRMRCCEYALVVLERWADSPEIHRAADLFEDLIRYCVGDAMSEVRSMARSCYRRFAKTWPDRSRRLFSTFDPVIQKLLNEEDGSVPKRYTSPTRERGHHLRNSASVTVNTVVPPPTTQLDRSVNSSMSGNFLNHRRSAEQLAERNLENVLQASQQQVNAIETMLKGMDVPDKAVVSTTARLIGKDPGSFLFLTANIVSNRAPSLPSNFRGGLSCPSEALQQSFTDHGRSARETSGNVAKRVPMTTERSSQTLSGEPIDVKGPKRILRTEPVQEGIPGFQRPLMRSLISGKSSVSSRSSVEEAQASYSEPFTCLDGLMSLNDALTEGLSMNADWSARVAGFTYLRKLLQQGPKGLHDVNQNFEKVMKLFYEHLDDPHHKVAQAALSTLAEVVPPCRKPFEAYLERILPRVFARLIDGKEAIRQLGTSALEIIGNIYSIDSLLPALLRSLDEQRSPKAKMAVIEFAIAAFAKLALNGEAPGGSGMLKLWLGKLAPLANDKNPKLKETAVTGIISVYSHFDSATVLNFILGLSVEDQSILRRALKQYTPRIEVDLMTYLQNRSQRARSKTATNHDELPTPSEDNSAGMQVKNSKVQPVNNEGNGLKRNSMHSDRLGDFEPGKLFHSDYDMYVSTEDPIGHAREVHHVDTTSLDKSVRDSDARSIPLNPMGFVDSRMVPSSTVDQDVYKTHTTGYEYLYEELHRKPHRGTHPDTGPGRLLQKLLNWMEVPVHEKREAFQELLQLLRSNDFTLWSQYPNQILSMILEAFDDPDSQLREISLTAISEIVTIQKALIENSIEIILEKLIHATKDLSVKVSTIADRSLSAVLSQCNPQRCLGVVMPLLVSDDDKTLVTCISCLTKLVTRLPQEELMAQLPSFLPALFDAFGNQNADVRKTVVFCLVDIYIVLGKAFVPYLGSLSSTQLRLVTIYANRISQVRFYLVHCFSSFSCSCPCIPGQNWRNFGHTITTGKPSQSVIMYSNV